MATKWISPTWRMPEESNQSKFENYSLDFDGTDEKIEFDAITLATSYTISVWAKRDNTAAQEFLLGNNATFGYGAYFNGTSNIYFKQDAGNTDFSNAAITTALARTDWVHWMFIKDSTAGTLAIYVDGALAQSITSALGMTNLLAIGGDGTATTNYIWDGKIGQVAVYGEALDSDARTALYNSGTPVNPMALTPVPVAYYPLGGSSTGSASTLTTPNESVPSATVFDFDGSLDYVNLGNPSSLQITGAISLSFWFNSTMSIGGFITKSDGGSYFGGNSTKVYEIGVLSNTLYWQISDGTTVSNLPHAFSSYLDGNWHHIMATWDGSTNASSMKLFADGVEIGDNQATISAIQNKSNNVIISSQSSSYDYVGQLSNVAIWNSDQATQISNIYNSGTPATSYTNMPTAWYKMKVDTSTWNGSDWLLSNSGITSTYTKSFKMDSASSPANYFNTTRGPGGMSTNVGTFSCWVNLDSVTGNQVFMDTGGAASREFLNLKIRNNNALQMEMRSWSTQMLWDSVSTTPFVVGKWYHVVAVGDGTNIRMYIDGSEITTYKASGNYRWWSNFASISSVIPQGYKIQIGAGSYPTRSYPIDGRISNAQIWNTDLSPSQIQTLYNNGVPLDGSQPAASNLLAWHKLNQDSSWTNYNYWNNVAINKWSSKNSAITTTPPTESFGFSGAAQDGDYEGWEINNKSVSGGILLSLWYKATPDSVYTWSLNGNGSVRFNNNGWVYLFSSDPSNYLTKPNALVWDYNWHNLIIYIPNGTPTFDATTIKVWSDGMDLGSWSTVGSATWDAFTEIQGMNRENSSGFNGLGSQWSNWAVFENVTPTDSVIDTIFNLGTPGDISSLNPSVWYKLDSTDTTFGTTGSKASALSITDSSSNGNNATGPYNYDAAVNARPVLISGDVQSAISGEFMNDNQLTDVSVNAAAGISSGMTTANLVNSDLTRSIPYSSYSMVFDGIDDEINFSSTNDLGLNNTVSMWVNLNSGYSGALLGESSYGSTGYFLLPYSAGFFVRIGTTSVSVPNVHTYLTAGSWHNLTVVRNAGNFLFYVDGAFIETVALSSTTTTKFDIIGNSHTGADPIEGNISNVCGFNSILTEDQILTIYNGGVPNDISSLSPTGWWSLAGDSYFDGTNWICPDLGSGSNNGTSSGMGGTELVGDGPGSSANGIATSMNIPGNLKGNAPNSSKNAFSVNMNSADRVEDVPE